MSLRFLLQGVVCLHLASERADAVILSQVWYLVKNRMQKNIEHFLDVMKAETDTVKTLGSAGSEERANVFARVNVNSDGAPIYDSKTMENFNPLNEQGDAIDLVEEPMAEILQEAERLGIPQSLRTAWDTVRTGVDSLQLFPKLADRAQRAASGVNVPDVEPSQETKDRWAEEIRKQFAERRFDQCRILSNFSEDQPFPEEFVSFLMAESVWDAGMRNRPDLLKKWAALGHPDSSTDLDQTFCAHLAYDSLAEDWKTSNFMRLKEIMREKFLNRPAQDWFDFATRLGFGLPHHISKEGFADVSTEDANGVSANEPQKELRFLSQCLGALRRGEKLDFPWNAEPELQEDPALGGDLVYTYIDMKRERDGKAQEREIMLDTRAAEWNFMIKNGRLPSTEEAVGKLDYNGNFSFGNTCFNLLALAQTRKFYSKLMLTGLEASQITAPSFWIKVRPFAAASTSDVEILEPADKEGRRHLSSEENILEDLKNNTVHTLIYGNHGAPGGVPVTSVGQANSDRLSWLTGGWLGKDYIHKVLFPRFFDKFRQSGPNYFYNQACWGSQMNEKMRDFAVKEHPDMRLHLQGGINVTPGSLLLPKKDLLPYAFLPAAHAERLSEAGQTFEKVLQLEENEMVLEYKASYLSAVVYFRGAEQLEVGPSGQGQEVSSENSEDGIFLGCVKRRKVA